MLEYSVKNLEPEGKAHAVLAVCRSWWHAASVMLIFPQSVRPEVAVNTYGVGYPARSRSAQTVDQFRAVAVTLRIFSTWAASLEFPNSSGVCR